MMHTTLHALLRAASRLLAWPKIVLQSETSECGLACIAMFMSEFGKKTTLRALRNMFGPLPQGMNLSQIRQICTQLGVETAAVRVEPEDIHESMLPAIAHWRFNHFVVIIRRRGTRFLIHDPGVGAYELPIDQVSDRFTGILLLATMVDNKETAHSVCEEPLAKKHIINLSGIPRRIFIYIVGMTIGIEAVALALPYQAQIYIDRLTSNSFFSLSEIAILCTIFLSMVGAQVLLGIGRNSAVSWLGAKLNFNWLQDLFARSLALPADFFERRSLGDTVSRFSSMNTIQMTVSGGLLESLFDGALGAAALVFLLNYSVRVTAFILLVFLLFCVARIKSYCELKKLSTEQISTAARQQTDLMESIRGIQTIKISGKESLRTDRFRALSVAALESNRGYQIGALNYTTIALGLAQAQRVGAFGLATYSIAKGEMSLGMMVALIAYMEQFTQRISSLIDKIVDLYLLRVHFERIKDISEHDPESYLEGDGIPEELPCLALNNVTFQYSSLEEPILSEVNFTIKYGESVAIVGPSGGGKTTMMKIIAGILKPNSGNVTVNGVDINQIGLTNYRSLLAVVSQDDHLFAGSLRENICFFEDGPNEDAVIRAARAASIHDEIVSMTMGYETLVGDMGSTLSGGQKQRIFLARALYRRPKILLLDEATSHLDIDNAARVDNAVKSLGITRLIIAHRKESIASADRVVKIAGGRLVEEMGPNLPCETSMERRRFV